MPADAAASSPNVPDPQHRIDELSAKLRESEARLALVRDAVSEGIYEWNIETNALWQSQRLREIFGLAGRELKAGDWNELVHPEDFEKLREGDCEDHALWERLRAGGWDARSIADVGVTTSARRSRRAPGGFSSLLDLLEAGPGAAWTPTPVPVVD